LLLPDQSAQAKADDTSEAEAQDERELEREYLCRRPDSSKKPLPSPTKIRKQIHLFGNVVYVLSVCQDYVYGHAVSMIFL
jgi:hypothetical protein